MYAPSSPDTPTAETATGRAPAMQMLRIADCELNTATRELLRHGVPLPIRRQVFDLLMLLVQRRPATVPLDELRRTVWGRESVAASGIARAVLEARRALGDNDADARLIVNVHGVGYRFAGPLQDGHNGMPAAVPAGASPQDTIQAHLQEAENAYTLHTDMTRARYHAEMALAEAMRHGLNVATGQALCWLGWLAMWSGSTEEATRHVQHALQLACSEQHAELQARARTLDAFVHVSLGDFDRAMLLLNQAHPVLVREGSSSDRCRCENLMSAAARHLGHMEAAQRWCLDAQRTARAAGLRRSLLRAQSYEAELGIDRGEAQWRAGRVDEARQTWQQALSLCIQVRDQICPEADRWLRSSCVANQAVLLGRLGRFSEARGALCALERLLEGVDTPDSPAVRERRARLRLLRVQLCVDEGDHARAMCEVQAAMAAMAAQPGLDLWKPTLLELASQVAESCGRLDLALQWSREHHAAHVALEGARARTLLQSMHAQSQQAALVEQLDAARRSIRFLEQMNAELLRRRPRTEPMPHSGLSSLG